MRSTRTNISFYKLERMASLALRNSIRLHLDSIYLFKHKSYPSSKQLSILSMEELGKAKELEHYYFHSKYDSGPMEPKEEQEYLKLYFGHTWKQRSAVVRELHDYSPRYIALVENSKLELAKQNATYVGLRKAKGSIDISSRIQSPFSINKKNVKQQISLINDIFLEMCRYNLGQGGFFCLEGMNEMIGAKLQNLLKHIWQFRSKIKSTRWSKVWIHKWSNRSPSQAT
jgi:AbiV family abortive infection protein